MRGEDIEADGASLVGRLKTLLVLLPFGETARRSSPCRCGSSTLPTNRHQIGEQEFGQTTRRCQGPRRSECETTAILGLDPCESGVDLVRRTNLTVPYQSREDR